MTKTKIKVVDRMTGRTLDAYVDTEKICFGTQTSYWLGVGFKCLPFTPERFATLMKHVKPGFGSLYIEAVILPDTVRFYVTDLVIITPAGIDIIELYYDTRLGEYGTSYGGNFTVVKFDWQHAKCGTRACILFGPLARDSSENTLRHIPIIYEKEYLDWLRAVVSKRAQVDSWEIIRQRLQIYEATLNRLLEELSKLADRNAYELAVMVIQQARQLMAQLSQLQGRQQT